MKGRFYEVTGMRGLQARANGAWADGLLPTAYPYANGFITRPDGQRILPSNSGPGSQAGDARALGGYGNSNYKIIPSDENMFSKNVLTGGSNYGLGSSTRDTLLIISVLLAVLFFFKRS